MSRGVIEKLSDGKIPVDYNWNGHEGLCLNEATLTEPTWEQVRRTKLVDEGLRDGLHGISDRPSVEEMMDYVGAASEVGIDVMTVGIFSKMTTVDSSIRRLLARMRDEFPRIIPIVLSLATDESLKWTSDCKMINPKLQAIVFMGTAPSRMLVEDWDQDFVIGKLSIAIHKATSEYGIDVIGGTEHTTQTPPEFLRRIVRAQADNGARIICIADTIGVARQTGTSNIVRFTRRTLAEMGANDVLIDWHGHRDTGNDIPNAMTAVASGADRVHVVARGIGERAGNTQMEGLLINFMQILKEQEQECPWNMKNLNTLLETYSRIVGIAPPSHGPLGERSHRTSLGIHTAAMLKAFALADEARLLGKQGLAQKLEVMARQIYTAVDPDSAGKKHDILVGPWSGESTVRLAYKILLNGDPNKLSNEKIKLVLDTAKGFNRELTREELKGLLSSNGNSDR